MASTHTIQARALELTRRLVRVPSCSRTEEERAFGIYLYNLLQEISGGLLEVGLHPVPIDPWHRAVPWALLRGEGSHTIVLMSHYDTVDTTDYGAMQDWATEPDALRKHMNAVAGQYDDLTAKHLTMPDEWLFGRGAADMKSGIAAHLVALEQLCERVRAGNTLPGNVLFFCTPDEESESAGVLAAVELLIELERERGIEIIGAINTDYTTARFPGDEQKIVYLGTTGKLLPSVYVRGVETHAGEPYVGCDANLLCAEVVRAVSMREELADSAGGEIAAPPVTLKATDFKDRYDVQVPFDAYAYFNYLTFSMSPADVLERISTVADHAMREAVEGVQQAHRSWQERAGLPSPGVLPEPLTITYEELLSRANSVNGEAAVTACLEELNVALLAQGMEPRNRSAHVVRELWNLSGLRGPAMVVYYSPPYYPHVSAAGDSRFLRAARTVAAEYGAEVKAFFPYISDGSYLSLLSLDNLGALTENMPLWREGRDASGYSLPLEAIKQLQVDVVNVGVWGFGAHKREERLHIPYSCGILPGMIVETVLQSLDG